MLSADQIERLETLLNSLEPEIKNMNSKSQEFVRDQLERVERYGTHIRVSAKQMDWLESLYRKHVGSTDTLPADTARRDTLDDDEVPF